MFNTSQRNHFFLKFLLIFSSISSLAFATDELDSKKKWLTDRIKARPSTSNIIVLGPSQNGKSTLLNLLMHTSEYATRAKQGDVLLDADDRMDPIYHRDIFRFDVHKPVNPKSFKQAKIPDDFKGIPVIETFMPVMGPIPVKDFSGARSIISFDIEQDTSAEKMVGGTDHPSTYRSHAKVAGPAFQSTFIDAQGIGDKTRLTFFKRVVETVPSDAVNAFLLVISAEELSNNTFGPGTFEYYKEISKLLKQFDPTFTRVHLAVTHASNDKFLSLLTKNLDPRQVASEKFLKATDILVSTGKVFFFENQYNCLSETAIESLYSCDIGANVNSLIQSAHTHRTKNYQLNVLESFNLLKAVAKTNAISRRDILNKITTDTDNFIRTGQIGQNINVQQHGYTELGSLTVPEGIWQITATSNYNGRDGNAYYIHNLNTKPNSKDGTQYGVDAAIGAVAKEQGLGSAAPLTKVVRVTSPMKFYLNVVTQFCPAGVGAILGSITAVRLVPAQN